MAKRRSCTRRGRRRNNACSTCSSTSAGLFKCARRGRFWAVRLHSSRPAHTVEVPAGQFLQLSRACVSQGRAARLQVSVAGPEGNAGHGSGAFNFACLVEEGGRNLSLRLSRGYAWQLKLLNTGPVLTSSTVVDVLGYISPCRGTRRSIQDSPRQHGSLRQVRLPAGWTALSFKSIGSGRLVVTDVPKACFSSSKFAAAAAPQVGNVAVGDEIVEVNGISLASLAKRIMSPGCHFNTCNEHVPGSVGKLQSPPCISCDFIRRRREFGLDLALQMWLRVVKQDMPITLGVRCKTGSESRLHAERSQATAAAPATPAAAAAAARASPEEIRAEAPDAMPKAAASPAPAPLRRGYNPLKPAAAATAVSISPKARDRPVRGALTQLAGGLCYEELPPKGGVASGAEQTTLGREVEIRFDISSKGSKPKVVERGQVRFVLGAAELKDGWVDGHVNLEEVLAPWAPAMLGMRAGQRRRVLVPGRLGFRDGGEVLPANAELSVDIEVKQL
ncbi:unnamed protein product [Symbiodinium sp. CCMP2592]|nr:unnamed protein product [Symbiodinium sp. CCMP2592]